MHVKSTFVGIVSSIYRHSGRGTIISRRNTATMVMQFFLSEAPEGIQEGDKVSFVAGQYKALDIQVINDKVNNVIFVDFVARRRMDRAVGGVK